jgi:SNF2 family DNA or RNA helicase
VPDTVEQRILELQEKKRELATAALSGGKINASKLTMGDLRKLFSPHEHDDD